MADKVDLPKGTIIVSVPDAEKAHELAEMFRAGGAQSAIVGETEEGEIVVAVDPDEFFALQGMSDGDKTLEITQGGASKPKTRGRA